MGNKRIDPRQQFSKWLARWTAAFWFLYMTWLSILMMLQPSVSEYVFYISIVVSTVMMINVISYSANSIAEKKILGLLDRTTIEVNLGKSKVSIGDDGSDADESEVSNG